MVKEIKFCFKCEHCKNIGHYTSPIYACNRPGIKANTDLVTGRTSKKLCEDERKFSNKKSTCSFSGVYFTPIKD